MAHDARRTSHLDICCTSYTLVRFTSTQQAHARACVRRHVSVAALATLMFILAACTWTCACAPPGQLPPVPALPSSGQRNVHPTSPTSLHRPPFEQTHTRTHHLAAPAHPTLPKCTPARGPLSTPACLHLRRSIRAAPPCGADLGSKLRPCVACRIPHPSANQPGAHQPSMACHRVCNPLGRREPSDRVCHRPICMLGLRPRSCGALPSYARDLHAPPTLLRPLRGTPSPMATRPHGLFLVAERSGRVAQSASMAGPLQWRAAACERARRVVRSAASRAPAPERPRRHRVAAPGGAPCPALASGQQRAYTGSVSDSSSPATHPAASNRRRGPSPQIARTSPRCPRGPRALTPLATRKNGQVDK